MSERNLEAEIKKHVGQSEEICRRMQEMFAEILPDVGGYILLAISPTATSYHSNLSRELGTHMITELAKMMQLGDKGPAHFFETSSGTPLQ